MPAAEVDMLQANIKSVRVLKPVPGDRSACGAARARVGHALACVALVAVCACGLVGCTSTAPGPKKDEVPDVTGPARWNCMEVRDELGSAWPDTSSPWRQSGGSLVSVHVSAVAGDLAATSEEAELSAATSAASAALAALESRGVRFSADRKARIQARAADALARGDEPDFPRVRLPARSLMRCTRPGTEDVAWKAAAVAEYPIGLLRGDVNNIEWGRRRLSGEATVLSESAVSFLDDHRWFDGLIEFQKARAAIDSMGIPLELPGHGGWDDDRETASVRELAESVAATALSAAVSLRAEPVGAPVVLERGARVGAVMEFLFTFEWSGERVPAVGVPVVFEMPDGAALVDGRPETDRDGVARCTLVSAYGPEGESRLFAKAAPGVVATLEELGAGVENAAASQKVFLVQGGHAVSVCLEFRSSSSGDDELAEVGCAGRLARDGFAIEECGPDVDVLLRADVTVETESVGSGWETSVRMEASAFDQRTATELARTTIRTGNDGEGSRREIEASAVREAGRLLAVYLERRMLAAGP